MLSAAATCDELMKRAIFNANVLCIVRMCACFFFLTNENV